MAAAEQQRSRLWSFFFSDFLFKRGTEEEEEKEEEEEGGERSREGCFHDLVMDRLTVSRTSPKYTSLSLSLLLLLLFL